MFTGIIENTGRIVAVEKRGDDLLLQVDVNQLAQKQLQLGDSIAVNGVCLTMAKRDNAIVDFYVSAETCDKTLIGEFQVNQIVNLETALTLSTPLGGHIVSGHVDGVCELVQSEQSGDGFVYTFKAASSLGRFVASKGSVTLDGISLTSNSVRDETDSTLFDVALVPHTINNTNLKNVKVGSLLHIEIDVLARYMQRMLDFAKQQSA